MHGPRWGGLVEWGGVGWGGMKGLVEWGGGCFVERESSDRPGRTTDAASFGSKHAGHRCAYTPGGAVLAAVLACRYIDEHVN